MIVSNCLIHQYRYICPSLQQATKFTEVREKFWALITLFCLLTFTELQSTVEFPYNRPDVTFSQLYIKPFTRAKNNCAFCIDFLLLEISKENTHTTQSFGYKQNFQGKEMHGCKLASCPNYYNLLNIQQIYSFLDNMERGCKQD